MSGQDRVEELQGRMRAYAWDHPWARENLAAMARDLGELDPFGGLTVLFIVAWDDLVIGLHQRHLNG